MAREKPHVDFQFLLGFRLNPKPKVIPPLAKALSIPSRIQVKLFILVVWFYLSLTCVLVVGTAVFAHRGCFPAFHISGPPLECPTLYRAPEEVLEAIYRGRVHSFVGSTFLPKTPMAETSSTTLSVRTSALGSQTNLLLISISYRYR